MAGATSILGNSEFVIPAGALPSGKSDVMHFAYDARLDRCLPGYGVADATSKYTRLSTVLQQVEISQGG